jgi:hypothetical protein
MVLGDSKKQRTYIQAPQDRECVSVVETISAIGRLIRPVIIFKGKMSDLSGVSQRLGLK